MTTPIRLQSLSPYLYLLFLVYQFSFPRRRTSKLQSLQSNFNSCFPPHPFTLLFFLLHALFIFFLPSNFPTQTSVQLQSLFRSPLLPHPFLTSSVLLFSFPSSSNFNPFNPTSYHLLLPLQLLEHKLSHVQLLSPPSPLPMILPSVLNLLCVLPTQLALTVHLVSFKRP